MNLDQVNKWLTLVANLGVVLGIVFVGYQIQLNTNAMRSNTQAQMVTNWNTITHTLATNPELIRAAMVENEHGAYPWQHDPVARLSSGFLASSMFRSTEYNFLEAKRGNVDDETWSAHVKANRDFLARSPFLFISWTGQRLGFAESFREFYDNLIIEICSLQACPAGGRPEDWPTMQTGAVIPGRP